MRKIFCIIILLLISPACSWAGIALSGDADYIDFGSDSSLSPAAITISIWLNPSDLTNSYSAVVSRIDDPANDGFYQILLKSNGTIAMYVKGNSVIAYDGAGVHTLSIGTWYNIILTYDSSAGLAGYVNGVSDGTDAADGNLLVRTAILAVGNDFNTGGRLLTGKVSEVAIWGTVISASDIELLSKSKVKGMPYQISPSNLLLYAPLDDFSDGTALNTDAGGYVDRSGNGNDGQGVDADNDSTNIAEEVLSYP